MFFLVVFFVFLFIVGNFDYFIVFSVVLFINEIVVVLIGLLFLLVVMGKSV